MEQIIKLSAVTMLLLILMIACHDSSIGFDRITGSGNVVTLKKDFTGFSKIEIGYAFKATITQGNVYKVQIKVDDNIAEYLDVTKHGKTLRIMLKSGNSYDDATLEADITLPDLESVNLSGATKAVVSGFDFSHALQIELSGASDLSGNMNTGDVNLSLSGASYVNLTGEADDINIDASGASTLKLGNFSVNDANVGLSGISKATLNLNGILNADLSGASNLYYYGNPELGNISTSGSSSVQGLD